ncbi:MAG TPA: response regulator transcription factor [Proteobacteria bacterium]|nr:response regulator MprA [bacterium BMS3Abin14]HDL52350.1 response regulator transcription factor [Pseudomonadota bacterium]
MRILIVDDEQSLLDQLKRALEGQRYVVETALDGEEALDRLFETTFDLIILDIMLTKRDGLSVLREIRQAGMTSPVLMLTARGEIGDRIKGLDLGADDYLAKPFSLDELLARIRALFRRSGSQADSVLQVRDLQLDTVSREVTKGSRSVDLTAREFSILEFLLYNKNRAVSRFNLAEHVWGDTFDPFSMSNFMDVHIKNLRRKIGDSGPGTIIRTIRGIGYIIKDEAG